MGFILMKGIQGIASVLVLTVVIIGVSQLAKVFIKGLTKEKK